MKQIATNILKLIALFVFVSIITVSLLAGFDQKDYLFALLCSLIFAIPSLWILKSFATKKPKLQNTHNPLSQIAFYEENQEEPVIKISAFDYNKIRQFQAKQLLESIYIMETTKNIDTLEGRLNFINQVYDNFILASEKPTYRNHIQEVISIYKTMYYDRFLTERQAFLLLNPNEEYMRYFCSDCIVDCFFKYKEHQISEIKKLKTDSAKVRRKNDIKNNGNIAISIIQRYKLPDVGHIQKIEIEQSKI
jgi:hypothetical protein